MSVFADVHDEMFNTYKVTICLRDKLLGGVPKDPKMIEGWLRTKVEGLKESEYRLMFETTLSELGVDLPENPTWEQVLEASENLAEEKKTTGFKENGHGLYFEGRCVKAMLKEVTNILYAKQKWGKTNKGPKNFVAERVFVKPRQILLGREEPDGIELLIGHGYHGSHLSYYEYVEQPVLEFEVAVLKEADKEELGERWPEIWTFGGENGLGSARSQGHGTFDVMGWERVA